MDSRHWHFAVTYLNIVTPAYCILVSGLDLLSASPIMLRATRVSSSCQQWSVPFPAHAAYRTHIVLISAMIYRLSHSCYMSYHLIRLTTPLLCVTTLQWRKLSSRIFWPLKMGPMGCPETSVKYYHYTLHHSPEDRRSQLQYWSRISFPSRAICSSILSPFSSDVFPSPFVLHTRSSHPPYNFSTDLASPSPVVLRTRLSRPPSTLMYFHPHTCYIPGHLIHLTTSVLISYPLLQSCYMPVHLVSLQFWCISIPVRATYPAVSSISQLQYWSPILFPSRLLPHRLH
jgi:hypothetical protein